MYAHRPRSGGINPASLSLALAINAAALAALMFVNPAFRPAFVDPPIRIYNVPVDPSPPDPITPEPQPRAQPQQPIETVTPLVRPEKAENAFVPPEQPPLPPTSAGSAASGLTATVIDPPEPTPPVLVGADIDPRFARDFQPLYPAAEQRAGRDGRVVVRVLIGIDGRVKQIEPVSATSDAFFRATRERALSKWRFRPATRDGIPVEQWKTLSLRFEITD